MARRRAEVDDAEKHGYDIRLFVGLDGVERLTYDGQEVELIPEIRAILDRGSEAAAPVLEWLNARSEAPSLATKIQEFRDLLGLLRVSSIVHFLLREWNRRFPCALAEATFRGYRAIGQALRESVAARGTHTPGTRGSKPSLPDGVGKKESHEWQQLASIGDADLEAYFARCRSNGKPASMRALMQLAKTKGVPPKPQDRESPSSNSPVACTFTIVEKIRGLELAASNLRAQQELSWETLQHASILMLRVQRQLGQILNEVGGIEGLQSLSAP
jgi:hypothetical protein